MTTGWYTVYDKIRTNKEGSDPEFLERDICHSLIYKVRNIQYSEKTLLSWDIDITFFEVILK